MIYIVHGDNSSQSRALILNQQKKLGVETRIEIEADQITPEQLYEKTVSSDLFGNLPFIVLDVTNINKQAQELFIKIFKRIPDKTNLIIYSQKTLTKTSPILTMVDDSDVKLVASSKETKSNIFKFVDNLFYKNRSETYLELEKLVHENADPFYIISMILYGARTLANYIYDSPAAVSMKPFVKSKVEKQSKAFTKDSVKTIFNNLYEIDKKTKVGELSPDLAVTIAVEKILSI
jgi:DNA polymerase III delta subunit